MNLHEKWQIEAGGEIYEAEFGELESWINEGSLLRKDLVRRGSLRWIEAEKVPALIEFFNAKDSGIAPSTIVISTTMASTEIPDEQNFVSSEVVNNRIIKDENQNNYPEFAGFENSPQNFKVQPENFQTNAAAVQNDLPSAEFCCFHPEIESIYFCQTCANGFCKQCPKSYGGAVKICPCCGAMCESLKEKRETTLKKRQMKTALAEGFGFGDFAKALLYPFKFKASLIFGALFFAFFAYGLAAASFGGVMMFAALICLLGMNMLGFGILSNTLENFSHGKIDADFMPNFETFSMWDDVVHPFFLSIGVCLISFGLFVAILIGAWFAFSWTNGAANDEAMKQAARINQIRGQQAQSAATVQPQALTAESVEKSHDADSEKIQKLLAEAQKADATENGDFNAPAAPTANVFQSLINLALPFAAALLISFVWGIFYFPAACAVAGYTRSFAATLNIFVGFDTIKRLGADYLKILLMCLILFAAAGLITSISGRILSPFEMPLMGNIPLKIITGILTFYITVVFACVLGAAIYKNAGKLDLMKS